MLNSRTRPCHIHSTYSSQSEQKKTEEKLHDMCVGVEKQNVQVFVLIIYYEQNKRKLLN